MRTDTFGQVIVDEDDIFQSLYKGQSVDLSALLLADEKIINQFNSAVKSNADSISTLNNYSNPREKISDFDQRNQSNWFMPDEYKNMDIEGWILDKCFYDIETRRVEEELDLFRQHNMITVLKYLKYLVDTMRNNNIVWGVGRGSSVASYCLYLLGIHKVDSIKYQLDIREFLK